MGDEATVDRVEAWKAFSEEECATIAMGLTLVSLDVMYDITGAGVEFSELRKASTMLTVAELMNSMAERMDSGGVNLEQIAALRERVAMLEAQEDAED